MAVEGERVKWHMSALGGGVGEDGRSAVAVGLLRGVKMVAAMAMGLLLVAVEEEADEEIEEEAQKDEAEIEVDERCDGLHSILSARSSGLIIWENALVFEFAFMSCVSKL